MYSTVQSVYKLFSAKQNYEYFYASAITAFCMDSNFSNYAQKYLHVAIHLSPTPIK